MFPDTAPHPDDDTLLDLVTSGAADAAVVEHVGSCRRCAEDVRALRDTVGLLREGAPELVPAPSEVWSSVLAELDEDRSPHVVPDASPPTAGAGRAPDEPVSGLSDRRRRVSSVSAWWLLAAAAVGVVLGGVGRGAIGGDDPTPDPTTVVARASLDTLDTGSVLGSADAVRVAGHLDLDVSTEPLDPRAGYLEVWLINRDLTRMVSVGVLRPEEGTQRFAIDEELIDQGYVIVDISREGFDDRPEHSGESLARGTLAL